MSTDGRSTHQAFARALGLPFPLLADGGAAIASAYGVARAQGWLPSRRVTFVIDQTGVVRRIIEGEFDVSRHVDGALEVLRELAGEAAPSGAD